MATVIRCENKDCFHCNHGAKECKLKEVEITKYGLCNNFEHYDVYERTVREYITRIHYKRLK